MVFIRVLVVRTWTDHCVIFLIVVCLGNGIRIEDMKKYRRVPQSPESWEEIPCFDCCFGNKNTGDCEAPQEIIELNEPCGYEFHSTAYIYEEVDEEC